jgi:hypothetical protein
VWRSNSFELSAGKLHFGLSAGIWEIGGEIVFYPDYFIFVISAESSTFDV